MQYLPQTLNDFLQTTQHKMEALLPHCLPPSEQMSTHTLHEAMRYVLSLSGKRMRPALVYATGQLFDCNTSLLDAAACAIELIHTYSLVHDDLPCMDNDDLRRGKPTCHIVYGQDIAVLVGDALLNLSFETLANAAAEPSQILAMLKVLGKAAGAQGMIAGQALDVCAQGRFGSIEQLEHMHRLKTGALIEASVHLGVLASKTPVEPAILTALLSYAKAIGIAFQIQDDILDITSSSEQLGKTAGKDLIQEKSTYPQLLGLDKAKAQKNDWYHQAIDAVNGLGDKKDLLAGLAHFIIERTF